jgi:hypothetical protein|tara:strand:+ start:377 stop:523 length:147 start_codon:yes stop_codon:yes gene_type:complete
MHSLGTFIVRYANDTRVGEKQATPYGEAPLKKPENFNMEQVKAPITTG